MKKLTAIVLTLAAIISCKTQTKETPGPQAANPIMGTWKLLSGTLIEKGDTTITDYTKDVSFIKIINGTHFAFLNHDLQ